MRSGTKRQIVCEQIAGVTTGFLESATSVGVRD
jgi:hypothetical protein